MSDDVTFTAPQGGAQPDPGSAEPAATTPEATAPAETGAATSRDESRDESRDAGDQHDDQRLSRGERRFQILSRQLADQRREIERLERERPAPQQPPQAWPQTPEELERLIDQRADAKAAQRAQSERAEAFHEAGRTAYADWSDRCQSLMDMGADAAMSQMLVEMPDGAKVAGSLADDPEALERITAIKTERGRAIALGKYAASLPADTPARAPRRAISRAPAPIRPVTGAVNPEPNEYTMDVNQLMAHYSKQAMDRRRQR